VPSDDTACTVISSASTKSSGKRDSPPSSPPPKLTPGPPIPSRDSLSSVSESATTGARRRPLIRTYSADRHKRGSLGRYHEWKHAHMYLGRYSIEKLLAFEAYQRETSRSRALAGFALTPVPALLIVLILATIPLQSPLLPASANAAYFVQSALSFSVVTFGVLLYMRCAVQLPQSVYSTDSARSSRS